MHLNRDRLFMWFAGTWCQVWGHRWLETEKPIRENPTHRTVSWSRHCPRCGEYQGPVIRVQRRDRFELQL